MTMIRYPLRRLWIQSESLQKRLRCFSSSKDSSTSTEFVDPALEWGRQNPAIAEHCLKVPLPSNNATATTSSSPLHSLEAYWKWRQWDFSAAKSSEEQMHAKAIVSHVLSAPLTLATFFQKVNNNNNNNNPPKRRHHWCCVGARAEATLPLELWKEFLVAASSTNNNDSIQLSLDFIGPEIPCAKNLPPQTLTYNDYSQLSLQWVYQGFLHDYLRTNLSPTWTGFVLLNPGLGHAHLKEGWKPTLDYLLRQQRPIWLTAHSELDAQRDAQVLLERGYRVTPMDNPFASRITYQDPFDASHQVQPNHSVMMILP
jgi:hypothetical protein